MFLQAAVHRVFGMNHQMVQIKVGKMHRVRGWVARQPQTPPRPHSMPSGYPLCDPTQMRPTLYEFCPSSRNRLQPTILFEYVSWKIQKNRISDTRSINENPRARFSISCPKPTFWITIQCLNCKCRFNFDARTEILSKKDQKRRIFKNALARFH